MATYGPDSDYLRMDAEGMVHLCRPDGTSTPVGHACGTDDACPEELKDEFSRCYWDFLAGVKAMKAEKCKLVRKSRRAIPALIVEPF